MTMPGRAVWFLAVTCGTLTLATPIRGEVAPTAISADTTWSAEDNPYIVEENATVAAGATLTIGAGVTVAFAAGTSLTIAGELLARGSDASPVIFTGRDGPDGPEVWAGVIFADSSVDAAYDGIDNYREGSIVEHCIIEHATRALQTESASPAVLSSIFRNNSYTSYADPEGGAAIYVGPGSAPRIAGNIFEENSTIGFAQGGALYVDFAMPIIQDNIFRNNDGTYGGAMATCGMASPIVGNVFEGNTSTTEGGAVSLVSSISAFLNNHVEGNSTVYEGGGVHVCVDCFPHATPFIIDNTIINNSSRDEGSGGVGAAYLRAFTHNVLESNTTDGSPFDFGWFNDALHHYPEWVVNPHIPYNYWGMTDLDAIAETVFDGIDNAEYGVVTYEPILDEPPAGPIPRATLTTLKLRYLIEGDPMPVFLTLYNPDPEARELELHIMLQLNEDPPVPIDVELDLPDATRQPGSLTFTMPENSAFFSTLMEPEYRFDAGVDHGYWHAALFDATTGERIGDVSTIRFDLEQGEEE